MAVVDRLREFSVGTSLAPGVEPKQVFSLPEYRKWRRETPVERDPILITLMVRPLANALYHLGLR